MADLKKVLAKEMEKSNGFAKVVKLSPEQRLTTENFEHSSKEISAQFFDNFEMRTRSYFNAGKK